MAFELDGMLFDAELQTNYLYVLKLFTDTPCCPDICYFGYFNDGDGSKITDEAVAKINDAIKDKRVSLKYADKYNEKVEFTYWRNKGDEEIIILKADAPYEAGTYENVKRVKAYFALVKELAVTKEELADTKEELAAAYKELDGIIECEGLFPRQPWKRA
jgi:hypothetical protein